ncbi:MAG: ABC transporter permease subunit [Deltaproteobacteria bacterium]|nr:ABC transporter permease subunit [Deltaproteobacteria bacterium]
MTPLQRPPPLPWRMAAHAAVIAAVGFALYPVLWVVSLALDGAQRPSGRALPWPVAPSLDHFRAVLFAHSREGTWLFARQLTNSIVVSAMTALTAIAIATPAAYALARFPKFVGAQSGTKALLATQMFPGVASAIPLYILLDKLHLLDTQLGLILVYATTAVPFAIFQLRGAFESIPKDLEEAAMVDGATRLQAFVRVVLPAARPALAVTALFAFMSAWNEFILAATFLSHESAFTLPVALQRHVGEYDAAWGRFAAGSIIVSLPVMALFYALQKNLVGGLTSGGVKG